MATTASDSSTFAPLRETRSVTIWASISPMTSPTWPIRCTADTAFGLAYFTRPSASRWITPSPTRGAPRRIPVGEDVEGNSPAATIRMIESARSR